MQPTNNHAPGQDQERASRSDGLGSFEPGDSFTDEPAGHAPSGELPSWLQNFGDITGNAGGAKTPPASAGDQTLEGWSAPPQQAGVPESPDARMQSQVATEPATQSGNGLDAGGENFFSEDDLPGWLRALSTESEPAAVAAPAAAPSVSNGTSHGDALSIPEVSRAWVTASDVPETSPGANLLSSLVHVIDTRPETVGVETTVVATAPTVQAASQPLAPAPVAAVSSRDNGRWSRARILAVAALVILLLFLILMVSGS